MQFFAQIIHVDFIVVLTISFLSIFIHYNRAYDKRIEKFYILPFVLLTALVISDNVDYFYSQQATPSPAHPYFIMAGYILRVSLILSAVYVIDMGRSTRRRRILLAIPTIINTLVILTAPFNRAVFWIDEANVLHREILSYVPHLMSAIYAGYVIKIAIQRLEKGFVQEGLLYIVSLIGILVAVVAEVVLKTRGVLISVILLMLTFYYLYLHMEHFKQDNLTGALNRMSFFADLERMHPENITAFCEIDLNGLKTINDSQGHTAGDEAIAVVASIVQNLLPRHCFLYRIGGDEFAVLFTQTDMETCEKTIESIRQALADTPYSAAIGIVKWDTGKTFQAIYNQADRLMYLDKRLTKEKMTESTY